MGVVVGMRTPVEKLGDRACKVRENIAIRVARENTTAQRGNTIGDVGKGSPRGGDFKNRVVINRNVRVKRRSCKVARVVWIGQRSATLFRFFRILFGRCGVKNRKEASPLHVQNSYKMPEVGSAIVTNKCVYFWNAECIDQSG